MIIKLSLIYSSLSTILNSINFLLFHFVQQKFVRCSSVSIERDMGVDGHRRQKRVFPVEMHLFLLVNRLLKPANKSHEKQRDEFVLYWSCESKKIAHGSTCRRIDFLPIVPRALPFLGVVVVVVTFRLRQCSSSQLNERTFSSTYHFFLYFLPIKSTLSLASSCSTSALFSLVLSSLSSLSSPIDRSNETTHPTTTKTNTSSPLSVPLPLALHQ